MSSSPSRVTRRQCFRALAAATGLAQSGCLLDSISGLYVTFVFFGQQGSELYLRGLEIQKKEREEERRKEQEAKETAKRMQEEYERYMNLFPPTMYPVSPAIPALGGTATGSAGGAAPGGSSSLHAAQDAPDERAFYLLDTLGAGDIDGRVYAFRVQGEDIALRGQSVLRTFEPSQPAIQLRHIALAPNGSQLVVSQQGAPSQWIFVDTLSLAITARVPAPNGEFARRAIFSPDSKTAYLIGGTNTSLLPPATLHVADAASHAILGDVALPTGVTLDDVAVTPDGGLLIGAGTLYLHSIDLRTATYGGRTLFAYPASDPGGPRSGGFQKIVMDPGGARFYAAGINYQADNHYAIGVFDVRSLNHIDEIPVDERVATGRPLMAITPEGDTLLYAPQLGTAIQLFDTSSGLERASIPVEAEFRLTELGLA